MPLADSTGSAPAPSRPKRRVKSVASTGDLEVAGRGSGGIPPDSSLFPPLNINEFPPVGTAERGVPASKISKMFNPDAILNPVAVEDLPPATYDKRGRLDYVPYPSNWDEFPLEIGDRRETRPIYGIAGDSTGPPLPVQLQGPPKQKARQTGVQRRNGDPNQAIVDKPLLAEIGGSASVGIDAELLDKARRPRFNPMDTEVEDARARVSDLQQDRHVLPGDWEDALVDQVGGFGRFFNSRGDVIQGAYSDLHKATRHERKRAIGAGRPDKPIRKQVDRMTQEEWEALDPQQRAAVEFNAMLVGAVRRDRKLEKTYTPDATQKKEYKDTVQEMFGKHRGSQEYAPETVALLKQIGFNDPDADLDDFLGLKAAIRGNDLKNLATPTAPTAISRDERGDVESNRIALARDITSDFRGMKQDLIADRLRLETLGGSFRAERAEHVDILGGQGRPAGPNEGVVDDVDGFFEEALKIVNDPKADRDAAWALIRDKLSTKQLRQFMTYAEHHKPKETAGGKAT